MFGTGFFSSAAVPRAFFVVQPMRSLSGTSFSPLVSFSRSLPAVRSNSSLSIARSPACSSSCRSVSAFRSSLFTAQSAQNAQKSSLMISFPCSSTARTVAPPSLLAPAITRPHRSQNVRTIAYPSFGFPWLQKSLSFTDTANSLSSCQ